MGCSSSDETSAKVGKVSIPKALLCGMAATGRMQQSMAEAVLVGIIWVIFFFAFEAIRGRVPVLESRGNGYAMDTQSARRECCLGNL